MIEVAVEVYCSVVTGFERVSAKEISSKIENSRNCVPGRGNVRFLADLQNLPDILKLRSVDNVYVVIFEKELEGLGKMDKDNAMKLIKDQIPSMKWKNGIDSWKIVRKQEEIPTGIEFHEKSLQNFAESGEFTQLPEKLPFFRVTCKRAGNQSDHQFSSMDAASKLGGQINNIFGWPSSMEKFDIELVLRIEKDVMMTMIALNNESLFKRNICAYGPTTMRSTMCYSMAALADIRPGDVVIDAMCGGGSIPIEGAVSQKNSAFFIGGDHHEKALDRCYQNLHNNVSEIGGTCDFCFWDASNLPFRDESIDVLITDLPFGKKMGSVMDNRILYPKLVKEWERVVRKGGRMVLMTHDKRSLDKAIGKNWKMSSKNVVNVGGLNCLCVKLIKL